MAQSLPFWYFRWSVGPRAPPFSRSLWPNAGEMMVKVTTILEHQNGVFLQNQVIIKWGKWGRFILLHLQLSAEDLQDPIFLVGVLTFFGRKKSSKCPMKSHLIPPQVRQQKLPTIGWFETHRIQFWRSRCEEGQILSADMSEDGYLHGSCAQNHWQTTCFSTTVRFTDCSWTEPGHCLGEVSLQPWDICTNMYICMYIYIHISKIKKNIYIHLQYTYNQRDIHTNISDNASTKWLMRKPVQIFWRLVVEKI